MITTNFTKYYRLLLYTSVTSLALLTALHFTTFNAGAAQGGNDPCNNDPPPHCLQFPSSSSGPRF
jgi:hypothetical protein